MNNKDSYFFYTLWFVLLLVYLITLRISLHGYGYHCYRGYYHGPSFWYWGGPNVFYERSIRSGSTSGPSRHLGGGPHSGK